jgi:hypothetical protein
MNWSFHNYYANKTDGLISKLRLTQEQMVGLKSLRKTVRNRIKTVFDEAKTLAQRSDLAVLSMESFKVQVQKTRLKYLDPAAQDEITRLIKNMDSSTRAAFLQLSPRFWTQGSFQYDTLNRPYFAPPQEMDIDDGTYLPMTMFADKPVIGHRLLLLLVDSSLKSLVHENEGWVFETKRTCARIKILDKHTHIDVPMYAIPDDVFKSKEEASLASLNEAFAKSLDSVPSLRANNRAYYALDSNAVNLALRGDDEKWATSDPKIVEDWFEECCLRIGEHLKDVCRYMKAWRDVQWPHGKGPSSISLMAATVSILDRVPHDMNDLGATMKIIAQNLYAEFASGVESPDDTDEKPLFPPQHEHGDQERAVMAQILNLNNILTKAQSCETKDLALQTLNQAFGQRVIRSDLIVRKESAPAFKNEPDIRDKPKKISTTMASG